MNYLQALVILIAFFSIGLLSSYLVFLLIQLIISIRAKKVNRNGRVYLANDLLREINSPRTTELINSGYFHGESKHPTDPGRDIK